ncbi:formate/nitrite transporter family protein [Halorubrum sp. AD140]|uniref:formate/nitrite transporter family protein n=1 Tax=Halorubrum sp. AD140 TaxID=3050073 RepID=UPI002ACD05C1|nr:formate/nitrite transporter family protein [Halorubrum sp. AD140]MDZ5810889.1 formate/nitrite transporter family protein [Halorubrum sp. AD140]
MTAAPVPSEIFRRAAEEGKRRLDQSLLELVSTSFIAGFTIVFGIVAQGIVHAAVEPQFGDVAHVVGALAFGIGVVLLVVGRAELFNENFFDPMATMAERRETEMIGSLLRLWTLTFVFNLVGGALFVLVFTVEGALPAEAVEALAGSAEEIANRGPLARFASAIVGGALVSLLSFLLVAVNSVGSRLVLAYLVGFLLALGPFDHVVVTLLHAVFGVLSGVPLGFGTLATVGLVATAGNLVGGIGLVATTHVAQAMGARESND